MRRSAPTHSLSMLAVIVAAGVALTACGGGGDDAAETSSAPVDVASKALKQEDLGDGFTVTDVPSDNAMMSALQSVQQVKDSKIEPAACKEKNVAAQEEIAETVKAGAQQTVAKGDSVLFGVTLLPGEVKTSTFEAAGTGECANVTLGGSLKQTTVRKDLPSGADGASGFIFEIERKVENDTAVASSAYFTKNGVTAMINANPGKDGKIDQAGFEELIGKVAGKL